MTYLSFRQPSGNAKVPEEAKVPKEKGFLRQKPGSLFPHPAPCRRFLRRG